MSIRLGNSALECTVPTKGSYVLHALIQINENAVHFQRDVNLKWSQVSIVVQGGVTAPPSVASAYTSVRGPGFIYVGTAATISSGNSVVSYLRTAFTNLWSRGLPISSAGSIATCVQSPCLELPATSAQEITQGDCLVLERNELVHYVGTARNAVVSSAATGAATAIYTPYRPSADVPYNIDALVLEGRNIVHYWMDGASRKWTRGPVVSSAATAAACMVESAARSDNSKPGNFEALIPEGSNLVHYWRNNSGVGQPWARTVVVSSHSTGSASIAMAGYGDSNNPNLEALVQEGNTVYHYWRNNQAAGNPWIKDAEVVSG